MSDQDRYALAVVGRHQSSSSIPIAQAIITQLYPVILAWSNGCLDSMSPSGSIAKGTAIIGASDVDILISLKATTTTSLRDIYESLFNHLHQAGYAPRRQNVSIGITLNGWKIDLVPAKRQTAISHDHSLWSHKKSSWRQTNTHLHIQHVSSSGRLNEIKLMKVWRKLHSLEFPSFLLEMSIINALHSRNTLAPADNFAIALGYVRDILPNARILDPSNSNNLVSDDMTQQEKNYLAKAAGNALNARWEQVVW